jgi:hypothetical protein
MTTKRRGRPPSDGKRKTSAEYQRAYRERKKQTPTDDKVAHFSIRGRMVGELDEIANYFELSRAQAVNDLLVSTLHWILPVFAQLPQEIDEKLRRHPIPPDAETVAKIKAFYWEILTASVSTRTNNETSTIPDQI